MCIYSSRLIAFFFFQFRFTPRKAALLQKVEDKDEKHTGKLTRRTLKIKGVY